MSDRKLLKQISITTLIIVPIILIIILLLPTNNNKLVFKNNHLSKTSKKIINSELIDHDEVPINIIDYKLKER